MFRRIYNAIALRLYSVGKLQYEKRSELQMLKRCKAGEGTRIYDGASIINLANDPGKIVLGKNCHISGMLLVYNYGGKISFGSNCSLSNNSRIVSVAEVTIGDRVMIAHNVNILDNISHPIDAKQRHQDFIDSYTSGMHECDIKPAAITIEDDVWIGFNSSIMKGVRIGRGAIIGANSVVTKDIKPWTVNVGNPLRCIRELEPIEVNNIN